MQETPQTTARATQLQGRARDALTSSTVTHRAIQKLVLCTNGGGLEPPGHHHSPRRLCEQFPNCRCGQQGPLNHCAAPPPPPPQPPTHPTVALINARYLDAATYSTDTDTEYSLWSNCTDTIIKVLSHCFRKQQGHMLCFTLQGYLDSPRACLRRYVCTHALTGSSVS